jgi:thymidine phosphorylase
MSNNFLYLRRLGIDTYQEPVVYMREDCDICRAEGFSSHNRVQVNVGERHILATVHTVNSSLLHHDEAGLSEAAWNLLAAHDRDKAHFSHPAPVESMSYVRGKLYGNRLSDTAASAIIADIRDGRYSDIQLAAYVAASADRLLDTRETIAITRAMVSVPSPRRPAPRTRWRRWHRSASTSSTCAAWSSRREAASPGAVR